SQHYPRYFSLRQHPPRPSPPFSLTTPAPPAIYTLSLHDALPIYRLDRDYRDKGVQIVAVNSGPADTITVMAAQAVEFAATIWTRSEEHTSELQSPYDLVCRLLLEKKKKTK